MVCLYFLYKINGDIENSLEDLHTKFNNLEIQIEKYWVIYTERNNSNRSGKKTRQYSNENKKA